MGGLEKRRVIKGFIVQEYYCYFYFKPDLFNRIIYSINFHVEKAHNIKSINILFYEDKVNLNKKGQIKLFQEI